MHDRIEAIGGVLTVDPQPGRGTCVIGSVQLRLQTLDGDDMRGPRSR